MLRVFLAGGLLVMVSGCATPVGPVGRITPAPTTVTAVLACQDAINLRQAAPGADAPGADTVVVLNAVGLPRNALQANVSGSSDIREAWFAKVGLYVASGANFDLVVPPAWVTKVKIGWGSPGVHTTRLHVSGCQSSDRRKPWLVFAGGFWVSQVACVPLLVRSGGNEQTVMIGVGSACPGQIAPAAGS